jgi:hypothetical protein
MPEWRLANARLTVFVAPDTVVPLTIWRDLIGEEPEASGVQRATATRIESGPFADGTLKLQVQPMRIDCVHERDGLEIQEGLPPALGPFPDAAGPLLQFGRRWVTSAGFPSILRIALGLTLLSPTPDRETGYRELGQFVDGVPNTPDARDFLYQINRPRASRAGIEGMQVNRLSRWSVGTVQFFAVAFGGTANPTSVTSARQYHLRLELDISSSEDYQGVIPRAGVEGLITDLFSGAREISEQGNRIE